jgi:tripartite-type tricarboxylate transporter receptor subunit TctC
LNREVNDILVEPEMKARLEADGSAVRQNSPAQFSEFVVKELVKYEGLIKATGIQVY